MNNTYSFPRYVTLSSKTVMFGLLGRVMWVSALFVIPLIWYAVGAPLAGFEWFAIIMSVTLTTIVIVGFYLSNCSLHRLYGFYKPKCKGTRKLLSYIVHLFIPIPILELKWLFGNKTKDEEIVRAFLQSNEEDDRISLFYSFFLFFEGTPEMNACKIAEFIREQYFASTGDEEGEYAISIITRQYEFMCLIQRDGTLYMFSELDPSSVFSYLPTGWRFEKSQDTMSAAIVFKKTIDQLNWENSKYIANIILEAIDEILKVDR